MVKNCKFLKISNYFIINLIMCTIYKYDVPKSGMLNIDPEYNILKNGYNLYYDCKGNEMTVYISKIEMVDINQNKLMDFTHSLGFIEFSLDKFNDINIKFLVANIKRKKIGHYLMIIVAYMGIKLGIDKINLENESKIDDYYSKLGCSYDNIGFPEMTCDPRFMLDTFSELKSKITPDNPFFISSRSSRSSRSLRSSKSLKSLKSPIRKKRKKKRNK